MRTALFVNAKSRKGARLFEDASAALADNGVHLSERALFRNPRRMARAIQQARDAAFDVVIVGGGDGTLNSAAGILAGSSTALGVLPLGTGNAFARDLGITSDLGSACEIISAGNVVNVDVGKIAGKPFLSVATIGLSSIVAASLNPIAKRFLGPLAYLGPIIQAVLRVRPFEARIVADGREEIVKCMQIVLGNGRYHAGPFLLKEDAHLASGQLVLYAVLGDNKGQLLRYASRLATGKLETMDGLEVWTLKSGRIETSPSKVIIADGERAGKTPAEFEVWEGGLRVLAPKTLPGQSV